MIEEKIIIQTGNVGLLYDEDNDFLGCIKNYNGVIKLIDAFYFSKHVAILSIEKTTGSSGNSSWDICASIYEPGEEEEDYFYVYETNIV